jgi:hypothetical protein
MKTAMKLTIGILTTAITMTAAGAWAQNVDAIDQARSVAKSLQTKQEVETNAALDAAGTPNTAKPAPGAPAPAVKPAAIPGAGSAAASATPAAKTSSSTPAGNELRRVNIVQGADTVRVEMVATGSVTPRVSKLTGPDRVLVELPETADLSPQNHIAFGSAGVKGVRIGSNGKNPPTTSVVVDLEQACAYELTPGTDGKMVLTLHTDVMVKKAPTAPKPAPAPAVTKNNPPAAPKAAAAATSSAKPAVAKTAEPKATPAKAAIAKTAAPKATPAKTVIAAKEQPKPAPAQPLASASKPEAVKPEEKKDEKKEEDKKWAMSGKRDPFFSPVVQQSGSGCTTGKKCLEIGNINLRGVVKSDNGFIAVVTNNLNKAYFLRENDPVFNGYVVRITGDSVVFSETVQDKLGKPFTREIVKRIFTPAV